MGRPRIVLQTVLEEILGSKNVYFQPPESVKLRYPCIIYTKIDEDPFYANDKKYNNMTVYDVNVIDYDPDSAIPGKVSDLPYSSFNRFYTSDGLNHNVYRLYF